MLIIVLFKYRYEYVILREKYFYFYYYYLKSYILCHVTIIIEDSGFKFTSLPSNENALKH